MYTGCWQSPSTRQQLGARLERPVDARSGHDRHPPRPDHLPAGPGGNRPAVYCGVLGLIELPKPDSLVGRGGIWLSLGDRQLHIGTEEGFDRRATKAHVAYAVVDLPGWRERLAAAGIEAIEGVPIPGHRRFEFRDPFGNRVEFIEAVQPPRTGRGASSGAGTP